MANVTLGWGGEDFSLSWNRDKVKFFNLREMKRRVIVWRE